MTKYITTKITCPSQYREGETDLINVGISDPRRRPEDCCGRVQVGDWSTKACDKPAKVYHEAEVNIVDTVKGRETFTYQVGFCGVHDPVRKAQRKLNKRIKDQAEARAERDMKDRVEAHARDQVARINEAIGEGTASLGWNQYSRTATVNVHPAKLIAFLETIGK